MGSMLRTWFDMGKWKHIYTVWSFITCNHKFETLGLVKINFLEIFRLIAYMLLIISSIVINIWNSLKHSNMNLVQTFCAIIIDEICHCILMLFFHSYTCTLVGLLQCKVHVKFGCGIRKMKTYPIVGKLTSYARNPYNQIKTKYERNHICQISPDPLSDQLKY